MIRQIIAVFVLLCLVVAAPAYAQSSRQVIERVINTEEYIVEPEDPIPPAEPYFLEGPLIVYPVTLAVVFSRSNYPVGGIVKIDPPNIDCTYPLACLQQYQPGTTVKLTVIPDEKTFFAGWNFVSNNGEPMSDAFCRGGYETCEITLDNNMTIIPKFSPIVDSDLVVSLDVSSQELTLGETVILNAKVRNDGAERSLDGRALVDLTNIKKEGDTTYYWSRSSDSTFLAIDPGAEHELPSPSDLLPPREGKYIARIQIPTPVEENMENNEIKKVVYVTDQATAVVKGSILRLNFDGRGKRIKRATLVLSGPENREYKLPTRAREYAFSNLKLGKYTLRLRSRSFQPVEHSFEIISGSQVKVIPIGLKRIDDPVNIPPEAVASIDPGEGESGQMFTLSGADSSDPDGDLLRYEWDFGDDFTYGEGKTLEYRFRSIGEQTVTLTVIDPLGASSSVDASVTVIPLSRFITPTRIEEPRIVP